MSKWKPKEGETYFFVEIFNGTDVVVNKSIFMNDDSNDKEILKLGNYYQTRKEATTTKDKIINVFKKV